MSKSARPDRFRIVRWVNKQGETGLIELYDHRSDSGENVNIANGHPDIVARLTARLEAKMSQAAQSSHVSE